jgi:hypothetical protein
LTEGEEFKTRVVIIMGRSDREMVFMPVEINFLVPLLKVVGVEEQNIEDMCVYGRILLKLISDTMIFRM